MLHGMNSLETIFFTVFYVLSKISRIQSNTVSSPQIRILDVATRASETRLIPHHVDYRNSVQPSFQHQNHYEQNIKPLKSYVIYDEYPLKIFKEWKANPPAESSLWAPQNLIELGRQPNADIPPDYNFQNGQNSLPPPKPTLAYRSVYSNVIKVFDNSLDNLGRNRFQSERYIQPFEGSVWKSELYSNLNLPENFPKTFSPNENFHFPTFDDRVSQHPKLFYPQQGFYDTQTINYNRENTRHRDEVEILPEVALKQKNKKKTFLCSFIRVNQRQFPESGSPCARSDDDVPIVSPEYPDYSNLPNDKVPLEHRRQYFQIKRIKRSELNETDEGRHKRNAEFGYGYTGWDSPFGYDGGYDDYFNYPSRGGYRNNYNPGYDYNRHKNQNYRNRYYSGSRYEDYDDNDDENYHNNDSNSGGLTGYLTNGGRRYKNRQNKDSEDDENDNNSDNNRSEESDEEMERMNSNRRDTNDRRNNDDSRDRRRNNNNNFNDDDDNRGNRRNNNRNNNSRRYNSNSNNRRNNDRYNMNSDYSNSNRNRYYSNTNGYGSSNGFGSTYGSSYGGSFGNGGYRSGYGSNGGYGYGRYGNGFGSF